MSSFTPDQLHDFNFACSLEWLETNNLGGYASSTVSGAHTRRYHGLLVASKHPPVGRMVVLSKLDETIITGKDRFELSANRYPGVVHPQGFNLLKSFRRDLFPEFVYQAGDVVLRKTIAALSGENTTLIVYEVEAGSPFKMELLPLCSARDFHRTTQANDVIYTDYIFDDGVFQTKNYVDSPELFISVPNAQFEPTQRWYHHFEFAAEQERGLDYREDLFNHGRLTVSLKRGDRLGIIISTENPTGRDAFQLYREEKQRREALVREHGGKEEIKRLVLAADQFVVKRGHDSKTVIAGYPWFSDWGRDTMISLPGLCLATGRAEDAKGILRTFAESVSEGMIPNRFSDYGEAPEFNTVDATLWFFQAIYKYYKHTSDKEFIASLIPVLKDIMAWHYKGTRYHIHVDSDELLFSGQAGMQLTWMDAKAGDWVVTPRTGKAVEVNALWFNALSVMAALLSETGDLKLADDFRKRAFRAGASFNRLFWNRSLGFLYDYVDGEYKNDDLRPNQIYALSLPFKLLPKDRAEKVLDIVTRKLFTPRGLRSLSPDHKDYKPSYEGDSWHRDSAYHQGTVWSFLLGPYLDAWMTLKGERGRPEAGRIVSVFLEHLNEAGVGTVSEVFDAAPPHRPRGCFAQAWGVGEVLRVVMEYDLFLKPI
ncbi:MAG TPA: amylo-alpha-1,6-glucosidase [Cyclobacteriaceae bacterium]|nr:amylo-alpha-1,6-glucosidase [Cyclobacteriaceae bacterium]